MHSKTASFSPSTGCSSSTRYAPGSALSALVLNSVFGKNALLFYGINKYATTHISDWNFKASLSSDISTFEMDFIFWTNPVFSFVCLDTIIAKPTSAIFELLSVE